MTLPIPKKPELPCKDARFFNRPQRCQLPPFMPTAEVRVLMSSGRVEDRIQQLKQKVRQLESNAHPATSPLPGWERVAGAFKGDDMYAAAMKLGAEIRKADQPEVAGE